MNAPTRTDHLVAPSVELLPLTAIALSETAMQAKRRAGYDAAALAELGKSIAENGLMHPVVVRPLEAMRGLAKYELVAGERRYLAVQNLGQAHVLARILALDPTQVLKVQIIENLQRENLDELAEAKGYHELMTEAGVSADAIGDMVGKSRSYVYARLKLLGLSAGVQEALQAGRIDASKALLIARLPGEQLQKKALKVVERTNYRGEARSYREAVVDLKHKFMRPLDEAPFNLADETLIVTLGDTTSTAPACLACPHYSANDPELARELAASGDAPVCTQTACYEKKVEVHWFRKRRAAEDLGLRVIDGDEARRIVKPWGEMNGYVDLDAEVEGMEPPDSIPEDSPEEQAWQPPTWREMLGSHCPAPSVAIADPHDKGKLIFAATAADVRKALKAAKVKLDSGLLPSDFDTDGDILEQTRAPEPDPEAEARERARQEREKQRVEQELAYRKALLQQITAKWKGPLKRDDLYAIADQLVQPWDAKALSEAYYGGKSLNVGGMNEAEISRLLIVVTAHEEAGAVHGKPGRLLALAKRCGVDAEKVRKSLAGAAEASPKKAKAKKKARK